MNNICCIDLSGPRKFLTSKIDDLMCSTKIISDKSIDYKSLAKTSIALLTITISACSVGSVVYATLIKDGVLLASTEAIPCLAINGFSIGAKIARAFQPLIDVLQGISVPIVTMVEMGGAITMTFNKRQGIKIMKDGAIAFLVVQFVPAIVTVLVEIGKAMR